jgi:argininosuccinate lyase
MIHLSRLSEELVLWMSPEFNFISLSDEYTTGSSLMPQKKNPDCAELIRGKSGRVVGALLAILMVLKGLPLAYNRDLQEDKERLFDAVDTVARSLQIMSGMIAGLTVNIDIVSKAASAQYTLATDLADHLVKQGVSFREAHGIVGKIVAKCISMEKELEELTLADLKKFSPKLDKDVFKVLTVEKSLAARKVIGGTAPGQVLQQLKRWQRELN